MRDNPVMEISVSQFIKDYIHKTLYNTIQYITVLDITHLKMNPKNGRIT